MVCVFFNTEKKKTFMYHESIKIVHTDLERKFLLSIDVKIIENNENKFGQIKQEAW